MNLEHYKKLLLARQSELTQDVHRYDAEILDSQAEEVGDNTDVAVADEAKSAAADLSSTATGELGLVQDALKRIENGSYGTCVEMRRSHSRRAPGRCAVGVLLSEGPGSP